MCEPMRTKARTTIGRRHKRQSPKDMGKLLPLGVSLQAVQAWEQGRRKPNGAALTLLKLLSRFPELVKELN